MELYFEKYHGTGNDFIIFNEGDVANTNVTKLAQSVCSRHFGIGADGILIVKESSVSDIKMDYYNADGSSALMCGNALRCFVKFVIDHKLIEKDCFHVETGAGILEVQHMSGNPDHSIIEINMGKAILDLNKMEVNLDGKHFINQELVVNDQTIQVSIITMGVLHTVIVVDALDLIDVETLGKEIGKLPIFPKQTNVNFVEVKDEKHLYVKTYERGVGQTLSCGTGVCASYVISRLIKKTSNECEVYVPGGQLSVKIKSENIYLTGPAEFICKGHYNQRGDVNGES